MHATRTVGLAPCLQEWAHLLSDFGWKSGPERLDRMCLALVNNDLFKWYQIEKAGDPSDWDGMSEFLRDEMNILRDIVRVGKKRPR